MDNLFSSPPLLLNPTFLTQHFDLFYVLQFYPFQNVNQII